MDASGFKLHKSSIRNGILFTLAIAAGVFTIEAGRALPAPPSDFENLPGYVLIPPRSYKPAPATLDSEAGRKQVLAGGCLSCHAVLEDGRLTGGSSAPMFAGIGAYRNEQNIIDRISNKRRVGLIESRSMSHIHVDPAVARMIARYLLTLPEPEKGVLVASHAPKQSGSKPKVEPFKPAGATASSKAGYFLFKANNCLACHEVQGFGGHLGPPLDGVGARLSRAELTARIEGMAAPAPAVKAGEGRPAVVKMPAFKLKQDELKKLVDYLLTLPVDSYQPAAPSKASAEGAKLYAKYQCAGCHTVAGKGGSLGPALDAIGAHRGSEWLTARLLNPEEQVRNFPELFQYAKGAKGESHKDPSQVSLQEPLKEPLKDPRSGKPMSLMPHQAIGLSDAKKIVAYLFTLGEYSGGKTTSAQGK